MAEAQRPAVGLSIGATNLAAVAADRAVVRKSVVTLYRQRPPAVGVLSEDSQLTESGLTMTDFVDLVGDPVEAVAADGSTHRSETLVVEGLRALADVATDGSARVVGVTHPAHWRHGAVDALTAALSQVSEWSGGRLSVLPDSAAALIALQADSGLPSRGIIAVCDFGGSGTNLTLVDAANGYQAVGPTVRHTGFSGDLIDQALLDQVAADREAGSVDTAETSAIDSLNQLRTACRRAKEELSSTTETTLAAELLSLRGAVRLTRTELDDAIRQPLNGFVTVVQEALQHSVIRAADLVAVASVGGGASIPAVTRTLIERLRVPVITTPRPGLTAAIGAALRVTQGPADDAETGLVSTAAAELGSLTEPKTALEIGPESGPALALAWSEVDDDSDFTPFLGEYPGPDTDDEELTYGAWYRRPEAVLVGMLLVVVIILAAAMIALGHTPGGAPTTPTTSVNITPSPAPSTPDQSPRMETPTEVPDTSQAPSPPPETTYQAPPPPPETTYQAPPPPPETTTQAPPPPPETTTQAPPPETPATTQAPTRLQPPRYPRPSPTNPFTPRNPFAPNPFTPKNPFAP